MARREFGEARVRDFVAVDAELAERDDVRRCLVVECAGVVDAVAAAQFADGRGRRSHAECAAGHEHGVVARRRVEAGCSNGEYGRGEPRRVS